MNNNISSIDMPKKWCNFIYDHPEFIDGNKLQNKPINNIHREKINITPKQPLSLMKQSYNVVDRYIDIPEELLQRYLAYRPTPLKRAFILEKKLNCNAHIYYKYEGANISGSHKLNTALAQAYYYKKAGVKHIVTGTGAGQWGTAIAYACKIFGLKCTVFMVNVSLNQKPQRKVMMELFGATVYESPSKVTKLGQKVLADNVKHPGSLAIATGEAIEVSSNEKYAQFAVGSGENNVLLHQTIIGQEAIEQMKTFNEFPDQVIACMGAGSNFGGIALPFYRQSKENNVDCSLIAVEPQVCPKLTRGKYAYDINDFSGTTPVSKMYTLGNKYVVPEIHAGGLRYHGTSEFLSAMYHHKLFSAKAVSQNQSLQAGILFSECEGILPAPESAHAIAIAIENALHHPKEKKPINILVNISGHGYLDLLAYEQYSNGSIADDQLDEKLIKFSLAGLNEQI